MTRHHILFSYPINWSRCIGLPFHIINRYIGSSLMRRKALSLSYASYENPEESKEPPVFILHGILASKILWEEIGKTILSTTGRRVVTVDLRNHGNSPHNSSHKYIDQIYDVLNLIDKLGMKEASLIGHCTGGRLAMSLALIAPLKVSSLLVVDISPISTPPSFLRSMHIILKAMSSVKFKKTKNLTTARMEATMQLSKAGADEKLMKNILSNVRVKPDGTIGWVCNLDAFLKDYKFWTSFPKVNDHLTYEGPTLFVGGQLSSFIPPDDLIDIRILFPKAVIIYVKDTGHYMQMEDPISFLEITISFLKNQQYSNNKHLDKSLFCFFTYFLLMIAAQ